MSHEVKEEKIHEAALTIWEASDQNCTSQNFKGGLRTCAVPLLIGIKRAFFFTMSREYKKLLHAWKKLYLQEGPVPLWKESQEGGSSPCLNWQFVALLSVIHDIRICFDALQLLLIVLDKTTQRTTKLSLPLSSSSSYCCLIHWQAKFWFPRKMKFSLKEPVMRKKSRLANNQHLGLEKQSPF